MKKWFPILVVAIGLGSSFFFAVSAEAQVDCVLPRKISLAEISGQVFDPLGVPIPDVEISIDASTAARTNSAGKFRVKSTAGEHRLSVRANGFEPVDLDLSLGSDVIHTFRPKLLRILLGIPGSSCPWATTSKHEFMQEIRATQKRFQEVAQKNATQK